jgi:homoserine O-acetyltransferase
MKITFNIINGFNRFQRAYNNISDTPRKNKTEYYQKSEITMKILLCLIFCSTSLFAQSPQQFSDIGDLVLENGDTILNCRIGYRTVGELNEDKSNIIMFPTWFSGTSEQIVPYVAKDKLIDGEGFYVIIIDALGNGISSSPNNSPLQKGSDFPEFTIRDMVHGQYLFLKKEFEVDKIYGAIGGSMGSLQVLEWTASYPDFIDKVVAYSSSPKVTANELLVFNIRVDIIDSYKKLNASEKQIQRLLSMQTQLLARTPDYLANNIDEDNFDNYFERFDFTPNERFTSDNYRSQLKAMTAHNIYSPFGNSAEETIKHLKSEIFLIVSRTDNLLHPKPAIEFAEKSGSKILVLNNEYGHLAVGHELKRCADEINNFFAR